MSLFHHGTNDSSSCDSSCLRYFTMMSHMMSLWNVMDAQNPARFLRGIHARLACAKQTAPWMFADAFVIWSGYSMCHQCYYLVSWFHGSRPCNTPNGPGVLYRRDSLECCLQGMHLVVCTSWCNSERVCLTLGNSRIRSFIIDVLDKSWQTKMSTLMDKLHGQIARKGCVNMFN